MSSFISKKMPIGLPAPKTAKECMHEFIDAMDEFLFEESNEASFVFGRYVKWKEAMARESLQELRIYVDKHGEHGTDSLF